VYEDDALVNDLTRLIRGNCGIMFHHFHGKTHPKAQGSISCEVFEELIINIGLERIVSAKFFTESILNNSLPENSVCLTFDDNLKCQFDIALPVLKKFGITALWNINTASLTDRLDPMEIYRHYRSNGFPNLDEFYDCFLNHLKNKELSNKLEIHLSNFNPKKYLSEHSVYSDNDRIFRFVRDHVLTSSEYCNAMDELIYEDKNYNVSNVAKKLWMKDDDIQHLIDQGHLIGLHTHNHPTKIELLSEKEQRSEYTTNKNVIQNRFGLSCIAMSHPSGSYNAFTLKLIKSLGVKVGFRADPHKQKYSLLELPRYDHAEILSFKDP